MLALPALLVALKSTASLSERERFAWQVMEGLDLLLPALLDALSASSERVVVESLHVQVGF